MGAASGPSLILTGFSFTGKTEVGRLLARHLGWPLVDSDSLVAERAGKDIPRIFAEDGEERFRQLEREVIAEVCSAGPLVLSAGGGAVVDDANREAMRRCGVVVLLDAEPETIHRRLEEARSGSGEVRPLLEGPGALERIRELKAQRQPYYDLADATVATDEATPEVVAADVIEAYRAAIPRWRERQPGRAMPAGGNPGTGAQGDVCTVSTPTATYRVMVARGLLSRLGEEMARLGLRGRPTVISDDSVFAHYGQTVIDSLTRAGFLPEAAVVAPGEGSKTLAQAQALYETLVARRVEREDPIVALGGGMVTDLAGFVAATFLRGLPLVHVPTSLVGMVDAAIGGKVAVDLPQAKNLVGAFYQPRLVLADVETLGTLPRRELVSGWVEAVKHGLILDADLFADLEAHGQGLAEANSRRDAELIARSAGVKAAIVSEDEREEGRRSLLNYGHTAGHALEAGTGYRRLLHGEAVALGMRVAGEIGLRLGLTPAAVVERQNALLRALGMPTSVEGVGRGAVLSAMALDKKSRGQSLRWVLLEDIGRATLVPDVPSSLVEEVLGLVVGG